MQQNTLKPAKGAKHTSKRVGRGRYRGTYSGRGMNGQNARSGGGVRPGFEGGQTPLIRRIPKLKGFRNPNRVDFFPLNLSKLEEIFEDGAKVDAKALVEKNIIKKEVPVKLLGNGDLKKKLTITVSAASASAVKKVEKAGGKVVLPKAAKTEKPKKEEVKES